MRVEEVVIDAATALVHSIRGGVLQGVVKECAGVVAVLCACPKVYAPSHGPSCGVIATELEAVDSGIKVFASGINLVEGVEAHQMALVAMSVLTAGIARIFPFAEDLRVAVYQTCPPVSGIGFSGKSKVEFCVPVLNLFKPFRVKFAFVAQHFNGFKGVLEEFAAELLAVCRSVLAAGTMLR